MDDVIVLIGEEVTGRDKWGNEIVTTTRNQRFCQVFGITGREFYSAAVAGLHPELRVRLADIAEYNGEELAEYHGETYSVIRAYRDAGSMHQAPRRVDGGTYQNSFPLNAVELTLGRKVGNG